MSSVLVTEAGLRVELPKYRGIHPLMMAPAAFSSETRPCEWTATCESLGVRGAFDGAQALSQFYFNISASEASNYSHVYVSTVYSITDADLVHDIDTFIAAGIKDVPMLYLLATTGRLKLNDVLLVLKNQSTVPWYAKRKYALDLLLSSCAGTEQGLPLTRRGSVLELDTGLAALRGLTPGLNAFLFDSYAERGSRIPQVFYVPPQPGELPAGYVFPFVTDDRLWLYNRYTRGTLRHVLARALHDKISVGRPTCRANDLCSIGPHAESNWN